MANAEQLIQTVYQRQDMAPLGELYQEHRSYFVKWLMKEYACEEEDAKDIFMDVLINFYEQIVTGKLRSQDLKVEIETYLNAMGKNQQLTLVKKKVRFAKVIAEVKAQAATTEAAPDVFELQEREEEEKAWLAQVEAQQEVFHRCFRQLKQQAQQLLTMFYYDRKKMREIAEDLQYKDANVAKRMKHYYLNQLRRCCFESSSSISH